MNIELKDILFLDIETVANVYDYNALDERLKTQWSRKANFFKRDAQQSDEEIYNERAGIYAEFGKVVCIVVGGFFEMEQGKLGLRTKAFYGDDEKKLLLEFNSMVDKTNNNALKFCAHNGKEFDFPYLCRRMLVNEVNIPPVLNLMGKKPWEVAHLDTMEMWKFGDYKHYTSLDLLTALFNIPSSKSDMDGSQVNAVYYRDKNLPKIKDYCVRDVEVLAQLYLKLKQIEVGRPIIIQHAE
ncbi:MAG TPA: 3'-5' exonuclease [Chryseolinea sp.]|nr:3'-5' exonuclease [Chryseolinea sp.]HPH45399.1 3'-5' exonuclease [Chryseolinea sp.]HPM28691.1 3'-5' exonuclease [Chryseolinea sp.]